MEIPAHWEIWEERFAGFLRQQPVRADAAHDMEHVRRVVANARSIAILEQARLEVVVPAAWLHDCIVVPKSSPQRALASRLAAEAAGRFLRASEYPLEHIAEIEHAIEAHSFSAGIPPRTREAMVVQDADRLDALGAIGIARCLMLGAELGQLLYEPGEPFPKLRPADDRRYAIDHFYVKLLRLADTMTTATGRQEARQRTGFMREYLAQLARELGQETAVS